MRVRYKLRATGYTWAAQCLLWCILIVLFASCERREMTYYMESEIEINIDWTNSGLDEQEAGYGATAVFYSQDGRAPKVVLMGSRDYAKVRLPEGRYDIVVFNRSFDDFACINFRGKDKFNTLEAYAGRVNERTGEITGIPEKLAVASITDFEVTEEMLGNYSDVMNTRAPGTSECVLCFAPHKQVEEMIVTVHIKGLNNVRSAVVNIDGVAASVMLATGEPSQKTVIQYFELENPEYYPNSPFNGTMVATSNSFTFNADQPHNVQIQAQLVDGKSSFMQSFTDVDINKSPGEGDKIILTMDVETGKVPDVKPEDSNGSGFDADVEDWGDEENGEIGV